LINFMGARVFVPNRSIANVVNYADGYVRAYVDVRLPEDHAVSTDAEQAIAAIANAAFEQYPGIVLLAPESEGVFQTRSGAEYVRTKFKIWPGQGAVLETATKSGIAQKMRSFEPTYADWMITVHYRAEPLGESTGRSLPRPAALRR
jgi:small conductance mechanosensitive channel